MMEGVYKIGLLFIYDRVGGSDIFEMAVICLGHNKDLLSRRSKYKSYGALRGCNLGVRDCLQVYCGK